MRGPSTTRGSACCSCTTANGTAHGSSRRNGCVKRRPRTRAAHPPATTSPTATSTSGGSIPCGRGASTPSGTSASTSTWRPTPARSSFATAPTGGRQRYVAGTVPRHRRWPARSVVIGVRLDAERQVDPRSRSWAETVLRNQGMPPDELRAVLTTVDRELVRRHLELHLERLEERLVTHRRRVAAIERILADPEGGPT